MRSRRCCGRCGLRGTQVGEAAHPGPPNFRRLRLRASSVSEPGSTVPASSQALQAVQRGGLAIVDTSRDDSDEERQALMSNRHAVLSEDASELERRGQVAQGRRLVLVSQNHDAVARDHEWDPDTESIRGASDVEEDDVPAQSIIKTPLVAQGQGHSHLLMQ